MKITKRLRYFAASFLMLLSTVSPLGKALPTASATTDLETPVTSKIIEDNGDGTYKITLSVTGKASTASDNTKANVVVVYDASNSMNQKDKQSGQTRSDIAKSAVKSLAAKLLANNTTATPDMVQIAYVAFSSTAHTIKAPTTNYDVFAGWVDGTKNSKGTNWDAALIEANKIDFNDNDETYVVFISDGNPTYRSTCFNLGSNNTCLDEDAGRNTSQGIYGSGSEDDSKGYNFRAAQLDAAAIVAAGKTLYSVSTFGNVSNMQNLNASAIYKDATDQAALNAAFDDIVKSITKSLSITGVNFTDGVTQMAEAVINGAASDFYYTKDGAEWTDAPAATYDKTNKTIKWNLGDKVLANGETATISFNVYPSQESVDLVADLNNGKVSYENLTDAQKAQIIQNGDAYRLKTNTDFPTLKYKVVQTTTTNGQTTTSISDEKEIVIANPPAVNLPTDKITLEKIWEDSLNPTAREAVDGKIELDLYVDGEKYNSDPITVTEDTDWKLDKYISIAPGLMVVEGSDCYDAENYQVVSYAGKNYAILRTGHDYIFAESGIDKHFELTDYSYHPMEVGGKLMNVKFIKDGDKITGIAEMVEMTTISATNTVKGNISIEKKVVDENGTEIGEVTEAFDTKVYLQNADGSDYAYSYRVIYGQNNPNQAAENSDTKSGTGVISESLYAGDVILIENVDAGVLYTVEENNIPMGYSLNGISYTTQYGTDNATAATVAKTENNKNYYATAGNSAAKAVITNKYTSGDLMIAKTVEVESGNAATAKAKSFSFSLRLYTDSTKTNELTTAYRVDGANTTIKSGDSFTLKDGETLRILNLPEGAYYEITEEAVAGYTTTATGEKGTIVKNTEQAAAFTNTYAVSGKVKVVAKKDLRGRDWLENECFTFDLSGANIAQSAQACKDQAAEFEIELKDAGTYDFEIVENTNNMKGGLTRETAKVTAQVVATDNGDGTLSFATTYADGAVADGDETQTQNVIVNSYTSTGSVTLGASKILTGRDWKEGETYSFTLLEGNNQLGSATVDRDHTDVTFDKISYTTADAGKTFVYIIRETSDLPEGMTNSGDITAKVTVTDNNDGTMTTTVVYTNQDGEVCNTIINSYSATGSLNLSATKELVGRAWKNGESYDFVLKDAQNVELDRVAVTKNGEVNFKPIDFTLNEVGTYTYTISEEGLPADEGLTKSNDISVTVVVSDAGNGKLGFTTEYSATKIVNTYQSSGEIQLEATKVLSGREWLGNDAFVLTLTGENENQSKTATKDAQTVVFDTIKYDQDDVANKAVYTYTIAETGGYEGMSLTPSGEITATVTLSDDGKGKIDATVEYSNNATITNIYTTTGSVQLEAKKKLVGRVWGTDERFEFALKDSKGDVIEKQTIGENETIKFGAIKYNAAGTYNYTIEETSELQTGMTNSGAIAVRVEVVDDYKGHLTATPSYSVADKTITNTYKASGSVMLEATKEIAGRDWLEDDKFNFELSGDKLADTQNVGVSRDQKTAKFTLNYTEADIDETYTYTIAETGAMPAGMTAGEALTVIVTVTDNGDGTLTATPVYSNAAKTITNTYKADGTIQLEAGKEIVGRDWLEDDAFEFKLSGNGVEDTQTATIRNQTVVFDELKFDESDAGKTYTYTITEVTELGALSMTNSGAITVEVSVVDKGKGKLEVSAVYTGGTGELNNTIVNTYTASGVVELNIKKVLTGRAWQKDESFSFGVFNAAGEEIRTGTASENAAVVYFDEISYDQDDLLTSDEYVYTIRETGKLSGGFTTPNEVTARVKLSDDGKGKIGAMVEYSHDATITNNYTASGSIQLEAEKVLTGARDWQEGECYELTLSDESEDFDTQNICANGKVTFKALEFSEEDINRTYVYTISESSKLPAGMTNDGKITAKVNIKDNVDGTLNVTVEYDHNDKIVNHYETAATDVTLHVDKTIDDLSNSKKDATFSFELVDAESGEILQTKEIATQDLMGGVDFDAIEYTKAGAYEYLIREVNDAQTGFSYDETVYYVTVVVTDNYETAQLSAESFINDVKTTDVAFTNTYKAAETSAVIEVEKKLTGMNEGVEAIEFEFELTNEDDLSEMIKIQPVDGYGDAEFSEIEFTEVGTYVYTVRELDTKAAGYTYDKTEYVVVIEVVDEDGELVATVSYWKDGEEESERASFTNSYATEDLVYGDITIKKVLEGRDLMEDEFSFELYLDGQLVTTGYNTAEGEIVFADAITFTKPGKYNFVVKEKVDADMKFIVFDENAYEFTIEVIDNGAGKLEVVEDTSDEIVFTNKYEEPGRGENPRTHDDILATVAMLVISMMGLIGSIIFSKRYVKE